jgi:hypothetical protein
VRFQIPRINIERLKGFGITHQIMKLVGKAIDHAGSSFLRRERHSHLLLDSKDTSFL